MIQKTLRLGFICYTDLSQHLGIYLVVFALKFFIHGSQLTETSFKSSAYTTDMELVISKHTKKGLFQKKSK